MIQRAPAMAVKPSAGYSGESPSPICLRITPAAMPISPMRVRSLRMSSVISRIVMLPIPPLRLTFNYEICPREGISFRVIEVEFESRAAAAVWICENQRARRNLEPYAIIILEERRLEYLKVKAEASLHRSPGRNGSPILAKVLEPIDVRQEVAKRSGFSNGTVAKVRVIEEYITRTGDDDLRKRLLKGVDTSINKAYKHIVETERKGEAIAKVESEASRNQANPHAPRPFFARV